MTRGLGRHKVLIKVFVSAALMTFLLTRLSLSELGRAIGGLDPTLLVAAIVCFFASNLLGAVQWHQLLGSSSIEISFARAFRFYFVGLFFNNFLPANVGGDAVKVYDVTRSGSSVYQVIAVTLLDRVLGIFSLCLAATTAAVVLAGEGAEGPYGLYLAIFSACMVPAVGFYSFKPLGDLLRRIVLMIRPLSLDERISSVLDHLGAFRGRKRLVSRLVGLSLVIQALRVSTHILVGAALGVEIGAHTAAQFFVFIPLLSLAMIPPVTINGLGIREGLGILLFSAAGLSRTDAFTMEFLTYAVSVAVSLLGFVFFVVRRGGVKDPV